MADTSTSERATANKPGVMMRTECPLCGGRIQATRDVYLDHLALSADYQDIVRDGEQEGIIITVYCENDHTHEEMIDAAQARRPSNWFHKHPHA